MMLRPWQSRAQGPAAAGSPSPAPPSAFPVSVAPPATTTASGPRLSSRPAMPRKVRIAVVGDVHDDWDLVADAAALHFLQADLVLFTGDFGNENVNLVRNIASLSFAKAAILGNHDSWYTPKFSEKGADNVQLQLKCLGEQHVGYGRLDFSLLKLSIAGGRPFSSGGNRMFREKLLSARYGVHDMEESANKIFEAALGTPDDHSLILLAHNGPTGLGSEISDICGRDWVYGGGDHGDPDLAQAISNLKGSTQISIPLVVFGHMHKELAYRNGVRKMIVVGDDNTVYLNGAIVPRVKGLDRQDKDRCTDTRGGSLRAFTMVEFVDGELRKISETWVSVHNGQSERAEERLLYRR